MSSSSSVVLDADSAGCTSMGVSTGAPSAESVDYVQTKQQFQLHTMLTEQRHPKTMQMSQTIQKDVAAGLTQLLSVDEDITEKIHSLLKDAAALATLTSIQRGMTRALRDKRKIYFYGCGATGRLAKLMESTFWRPFWSRVQQSAYWAQIQPHVAPNVEETCIGEMTGADRALISSLEGFEDLLLIGELQLHDRGIQRGDLVIGVTEGGETSSVIGTVLAALKQWTSAEEQASAEEIQQHVYMVYNNPDDLLLPFHRSASVIQEARISKLNLSTGPQAITGSTRMQATTSETFVLAAAMHCALDVFLRETCGLDGAAMSALGFSARASVLQEKLVEFPAILASVQSAVGALATFTSWEAACYRAQHFTTYFSLQGLMTVFIDSTERSPTFRLFALDTTQMKDQRKAWIQVWTDAATIDTAWQSFLGHPFRGLERAAYEDRFRRDIVDDYLKATALRSLPNAGSEQATLYDFSFSEENQQRRGGVQPGDLGCLVLMNGEEALLARVDSAPSRFLRLFTSKESAQDGMPTRLALMVLTPDLGVTPASLASQLAQQGLPLDRINLAVLHNAPENDPLNIRAQLAMKIALNAHSTGLMSILGKVLGNCMVNVSPGNLKLVGRATFLILAHVNQAAAQAGLPQVTYALANAVLYDSIAVLRADQARHGSSVPAGGAGGQSAEVALSVVRMLQSLADGKPITGEAALELLTKKGLETFLDEFAAAHGKK